MGQGDIQVLPGKPPAHQFADELNHLLGRWASTGLVAPPDMADMLCDALAQTMAMAVQVGRIDEALAANAAIIRSKTYAHCQRLGHLRSGAAQQPVPPKGKQS